MPDQLNILIPIDETAPVTAQVLPVRPRHLHGAVLGVLDNGKPNSDRLLTRVVAGLREEYSLKDVAWYAKPNIGRLAPVEMLAEIAARCSVVVTGVGDCAGCCSCTVGDAVALERAGVPVATICTEEFLSSAKIAATALGAGDYPVVVIDHPLGSLGDEELTDRVTMARSTIRALLTAEAPRSAEGVR